MEIINDNGNNKSRMFAKIAFSVVGACAVGVTVGAIPFVTPALRRHCLPFVPATDAQIENVLKALRLCSMQRPIKTVLDVGSGDGRIVLAAARNGYMAFGVEINRWLVWYSRYKALRSGFRKKTHFFVNDMWKTDLSSYDAVIVFGTENLVLKKPANSKENITDDLAAFQKKQSVIQKLEIMDELSKKLENEMIKQSAVIACRFDVSRWTPAVTVGTGIDTVWVYSMPDHATKFRFPLIKIDNRYISSVSNNNETNDAEIVRDKIAQR